MYLKYAFLIAAFGAVVALAACQNRSKKIRPPSSERVGSKIGNRAPDFTLTDHTGKSVNLRNLLKDHVVVLVFYPKDESPGCTAQVCSLRDSLIPQLPKDVVVLGISGDSHESHVNFAAHHKLPFPLLSDAHKKVRTAYKTYTMGFIPGRVTIIINKKGIITHRVDGIFDVDAHLNLIKEALIGK